MSLSMLPLYPLVLRWPALTSCLCQDQMYRKGLGARLTLLVVSVVMSMDAHACMTVALRAVVCCMVPVGMHMQVSQCQQRGGSRSGM